MVSPKRSGLWRKGSMPGSRSEGWTLLYNYSAAGTRTRVARVRAEYPNQLDYSGLGGAAVRAGLSGGPNVHALPQRSGLRCGR